MSSEGDPEVAWIELAPSDGWAGVEEWLRSLTGRSRVVVVRVPSSLDDAAAPSDTSTRERVITRLGSPDTVFVALLDGPCADGALALALSCDLLLAEESAELTFSSGGLFGALGRLARSVGHARAVELCLTGRRVAAAEAASLGIVNLVVAAGQVVDAVDDLAAALLATPREQAAEVKRALLAASSGKVSPGGVSPGEISLSEEIAAIGRLGSEDGGDRER